MKEKVRMYSLQLSFILLKSWYPSVQPLNDFLLILVEDFIRTKLTCDLSRQRAHHAGPSGRLHSNSLLLKLKKTDQRGAERDLSACTDWRIFVRMSVRRPWSPPNHLLQPWLCLLPPLTLPSQRLKKTSIRSCLQAAPTSLHTLSLRSPAAHWSS